MSDGASAETAGSDQIEDSVLFLLNEFGMPMSRAALRARVARATGPWTVEQAVEALESFGLSLENLKLAENTLAAPDTHHMVISECGNEVFVARPLDDSGKVKIFCPARFGSKPADVNSDDLQQWAGSEAISVAPATRSGHNPRTARGRYGHWFWGPLLSARGLYIQVALAAFLTNIFALSSSIFSMIVYDRVMPNGAVETLIALLIGVFIVFLSDFIIRSLRSYFLDLAGARADMVIADSLFAQLMDSELKSRKGSVGSTASIMREFETLRDFLTSATLTVLIDIPFAIIFLIVIMIIGGPIVLVPLIAAPIVIAASLAVQPAMRKLVKESQEDGRNKNSILVESLSGIETLKALGAGSVMRRRWQEAVSHQAALSLKTRVFSQFASNVANLSSQIVWVGVVTVGFFLVQNGQIGSGAIVACSMLSGRVISPLIQVAQLMTRFNQSFESYKSLDELMSQPREHEHRETFVDFGRWQGGIEFRNVSFNYPGQKKGGLENISFKIEPGERVAFIGPVGSGKSTITKLILGLFKPDSGTVLFDGVDSRQYDPADIRSAIGAVMQDVWLFSGTVKENIVIGSDEASDQDVLDAARVACVHDFISVHPEGYGLKLREKGEGLSGGQRQAICIARALVGQPSMLILDEATSAFDVNTERVLLNRLNAALPNKTVLVVTHRPSLLDMVQRVIIMQDGRIVANGPKDELMKRFAQAGSQNS